MMRSGFAGIALVALLAAGCSNDANRSSMPGEGGGLSGAANPPGSAELQLSSAEQAFVQQAARGNELEVELAKMAQDKAQNEQVKDYARQLEQDHSRALDELENVADRASLDLEEPDDAMRASLKDPLENTDEAQFDARYISQMIDEHRKDIAEFEKHQSTATGELRAYIDKTLPVLRQHLERAEALQRQLGSTGNPSND
jgi:putative membrane protein